MRKPNSRSGWMREAPARAALSARSKAIISAICPMAWRLPQAGPRAASPIRTRVAESIRAAVADAERGAQVSVEAVTLGIGGDGCRGRAEPRPVRIRTSARSRCGRSGVRGRSSHREVLLERDRMLLHVLPQDFTLDGRAGFRKPHKGVCSRLEANVHIVTASVQEHQALVAAAHLAHSRWKKQFRADGRGLRLRLTPEERARGVALLDMGLHSTDLVIYDGDAMLLASSIPVWADHLDARHRRDVQSHLRRRRMPKAAIWLRAAGPDRGFEPDRSSFARGPPAARSSPQRAE